RTVYRRLFLNTGSNLLVMLLKLTITFIMTPILVTNLGSYAYGLWEMLGAIVGYMGLLDLGIKPAISRFAAKYKAEKGADNLRFLYSSAFLFMGVIGLLIMSFCVSVELSSINPGKKTPKRTKKEIIRSLITPINKKAEE